MLCRFYGWAPEVVENLTPEQREKSLSRIGDIVSFEHKGNVPPPRHLPTHEDMLRQMAFARKQGLNPPRPR